METNTDENIREEYVQALVICSWIAIGAAVLRFWCQVQNEGKGFRSFHADDWLLLATLVTFLGAGLAATWGLIYGMALALDNNPDGPTDGESIFLKALFVGQTILYVSFYLAKLTVCMLYRRIFSTHPFRRTCLVLIVLSTVWFIVSETTNFCICRPLNLFWDTNGNKCLNFNVFALVIGIAEVLLDIVILVLPVQVVLQLQMPLRARIIVSGIFMMGSFSVITNVLRITYQFQPNSTKVNMKWAFIWCNVHGAVAILCACLPVYKPLKNALGRFFTSLHRRSSRLTGRVFRTSPSIRSSTTSKSSDTSTSQNSAADDPGTTDLEKMAPEERQEPRRSEFELPPYAGYSDFSGGEEDLVLRPEAAHYSAAARHSDLSGDELVHANIMRGSMSIAKTTKVEVV
ncbi:hypothetical protein V8F33_009344 [Rhypophila sp. PSN 637]